MRDLYIKDYELLSRKSLKKALQHTMQEVCVLQTKEGKQVLARGGDVSEERTSQRAQVQYILPVTPATQLGSNHFKTTYGTQYAYYAGAMANGIASTQMVIALGKAGFMGSFGAGGLNIERLEAAIDEIQATLGLDGAYLINVLSAPTMPEKEMEVIKLLLKKNVRAIEVAAFIQITEPLVYYRLSGLQRGEDGQVICKHHIIAKVSREEVAMNFMKVADEKIVSKLLTKGLITQEQAELAKKVPMADDLTVEGDSGGHTDNRPLISLLPAMIALRNRIQKTYKYTDVIRIGAAGGISTAQSALAAFEMGADYVVTGSVNQSCQEAGTSDYVKKALGQVTMADVVMCPCADMFEMGAKVQVMKKGTMFPMNAQKLYDLYSTYNALSEIPAAEKARIEKRMFHSTLEEVWESTKAYFSKVAPHQITRALESEKYKMALVFRWYLGQSSKWAVQGEKSRMMDYQIWCGQGMGAFNNWVKGTYLEPVENRTVEDVAQQIMTGAAYLNFINLVKPLGVDLVEIEDYIIE